jgi:two-component system heavy metal sensor histidine kinase CusS
MSLKRGTEASWSLTRRMALRFALTTSGLLAFYGLLSGYFVFDMMRDDIKVLVRHELGEISLGILQSDRSAEALQLELEDIVSVSPGGSGFRVHDGAGEIIAAAESAQGPTPVLDRVPGRIPTDVAWDEHLYDHNVAVGAIAIEGTDLTVEFIMDATEALAELRGYGLSTLAAFLVAVGLAALTGWLAAARGLRSLRDVVSQAGAINPVAGGAVIRLEDAPREVREVGVALNEMLKRIDVGLERMRTFTAGLAHELRSPLQNLIGETEVTLLSTRPVEDYQRVLRSNLADLQDLSDAVDNLIAYCRTAEPESRERSHETFDLGSEARVRLEREASVAARQGVRLEISTSGDTRLDADREAVMRVVRNLVNNAIHCSSPGTAIAVDICGTDRQVRLEVADQGSGIPSSLGERIFEPFVRGESREGVRSGYGLGLAICRSVMTDHRGALRYEARPEGGTRFIAEFPRE